MTIKECVESLKKEKEILEWVSSGMNSTKKTQDKLRNHPKLKEDFERADKRIEALSLAIKILGRVEEGFIKEVIMKTSKISILDYKNVYVDFENITKALILEMDKEEK